MDCGFWCTCFITKTEVFFFLFFGVLVGVSRENSRHFLNDNNKYVRERERIRKNNAILSENAKER